jgi:hypothetical protein
MKRMTIVTIVVVALVAILFVGCKYIRGQILDGPGMERDSADYSVNKDSDNLTRQELTEDTVEAEPTDKELEQYVKERQQYRFEYQFIKADDEDFSSIVVKGYKDDKVVFECSHELVANVSAETAADNKWINDTEDINFDGIPDLQVFLWYDTRGQVAKMYAAYVWTHQNIFKEVEQWKDLCNPQIHPESKTVTANYRSDINERTLETYKWGDDNKLELINTEKKNFFE